MSIRILSRKLFCWLAIGVVLLICVLVAVSLLGSIGYFIL